VNEDHPRVGGAFEVPGAGSTDFDLDLDLLERESQCRGRIAGPYERVEPDGGSRRRNGLIGYAGATYRRYAPGRFGAEDAVDERCV
jgi:hypothetical protein